MRIGKEAMAVVGKYMETFVREALARAAFEREEVDGGGIGDGFLQVEVRLSFLYVAGMVIMSELTRIS